mgnify:CR=1 FL=1
MKSVGLFRFLIGLVVLLVGLVVFKQGFEPVRAQVRPIVAVSPHELILQDVVLDSLRKQYQRSQKLGEFDLGNGKVQEGQIGYLKAIYVQNEIIIQQLAIVMKKQNQ